jgi:DivIVA domain-containing protein
MTPAAIRATRFTVVGRGKKGLDPAQVYAFLALVSEEMTRLRMELTVETEENDRPRPCFEAGTDGTGPFRHPKGTAIRGASPAPAPAPSTTLMSEPPATANPGSTSILGQGNDPRTRTARREPQAPPGHQFDRPAPP